MATRSSLADDAIDPDANDAVTRMGKTLSTGAFSFRSHTIRQYERDNLPLHIFHSADVLVRRPDRLMIDVKGDDGQAMIGYDGKTPTVYDVTTNKYGQMPISGNVETMLRAASERMGVGFPLADLLADQPGQAFLNGVVTGKKVGDVTIDGQKCNHFFFLQPPGIELELWSETDQRALPRRIAVTYRSVPMLLKSKPRLARPKPRVGHNENRRVDFAGRAVGLPSGIRVGCRRGPIWWCGLSRSL